MRWLTTVNNPNLLSCNTMVTLVVCMFTGAGAHRELLCEPSGHQATSWRDPSLCWHTVP
jgi:hypothetical protein